tara:strand:- start:1209 stop:2804 length:1596 start_codon:yes stop_codon:yes gene_type:complete
MKKFKLLDCTLRDGGYYNNWDFNKNTIQKYLNAIDTLNINFVELGFRFNDEIKSKGLTAYTDDKLINKLKIPKKVQIGIMINASDILNKSKKKVDINALKKVVPVNSSKKLKFIRVACHHNEIFKLEPLFKYFKRFNFLIFINIMQISEIEKEQLIKISIFLKDKNVHALYLADSLGALKTGKLIEILKTLKKHWNKELGIHAHDNLKLALKNSLTGVKNGINWVDSTITGMGRGPGNLKTEKIIKFGNFDNKSNLFREVLYFFKNLKKKYKWGTNDYYKIAALKKIHPTYIQRILSDKRYKKQEYKKIFNELAASGASKFNPYKLINSAYFISNKAKGNFNPRKIFENKNLLILGPGRNLLTDAQKIENIIKSKSLFVMALNNFKSLKEKYIHIRASCHPFRIMSDKLGYSKMKSKIIIPYSMLNRRIRKNLNIKKNKFFDYGLKLNSEKKYDIKKNFCSLPFPLAIGYALSLSIAGRAKSVSLAGFDGYKKSDVDQDETEEILKYFSKRIKITSITKTNLKFLKYKFYE